MADQTSAELRVDRGFLGKPLSAIATGLRDWEMHGLVDQVTYRPIVRAVVRALLPTRVRPNSVTIASGVAGVFSGLCYYRFTHSSMVAGALLLALSIVLDGVDGQLARARGECTQTGKLLDNIVDPAKTLFVMFGIAFGMDRAGTWGSPEVPFGLSTNTAIYGLGWLSGAVLLFHVLALNWFIPTYRRYSRGRSDGNIADLDLVRAEIEVMRRERRALAERILVAPVLFFARFLPRGAKKEEGPARADAGYATAMRPYMRAWTFLDSVTSFTVLIVASFAGEPVYGWIYLGVVSNLLFVPLLFGTVRTHRQALAAAARRSAAPRG